MDDKHRKHLQRNYMKLHQNIANIKAVVGSLFSSGILTDKMKSKIMEGHVINDDRITELLDILPLRGPDAYVGFLRALEENGEIAAEIIRQGLQDSSSTSDSQQHISNSAALPVGSPAVKPTTERWNRPLPKEDDELPKTWPLCVHVVQVRSDDAYMLDKFDQATKGSENMYTMRRISPRGVALIINNRDFSKSILKMNDREGTQYDEVSLDQLFQQLGYETVIENDCTAETMRDVINAQAQADHSEYDSFVCAVLSHGKKDQVCGVDGCKVGLNELISSMESCKTLSGKPKLFFIQACQGKKRLVPGEVDDGVRDDTVVKELLQSSLVMGKVDGSANDGTASQQSTDSDGNGIPFTSKTDTFVAMSTVPDFVSVRNKRIGSWFVQAVAYVFSHLSHKYELNSLMSRVNRLVSRGCNNHGRKQVSIYRSTLTKDFFFLSRSSAAKARQLTSRSR